VKKNLVHMCSPACHWVDRAGCRGREVRNSTAEPWPMSGTPVITHRSCPDDWLAQFSLTRAQRWPKAILI
jgi:hypothetical protein